MPSSGSENSEGSYEEEDGDVSESEGSESLKRKKSKKDKGKAKGKKEKKKEVKKKEKKTKKEKKGKKDKREKKTKKVRRRRRPRSPSSSRSRSYSYSDSRSPSRGRSRSRSRRRSPPRRGRSPPRHGGYGGGYGGGGGGYAPIMSMPMPAPRSPMKMPPEGTEWSIAMACEAAGRGVTTGQTAKDDEVQVLGPDGDPSDFDKFESFDEITDFPRDLREDLKRAGFPAPSQIQAVTWPLGLRGKDIIGIAATGSGKTLAFLLPAFTEMVDEGHRPEREGPGLLVMSPTRELAQQTEVEATRFGKCIGFRCVAMYGGAPKGNQMSKYRQGVHTIVACPGRLNDFLEGGQVRLDGVRKLVLDEADRMLDMGFEPQIRKILAKVPRKRQTMFFTATWPKEVRSLADEFLTRPYKIMIGHRDELKGNQDIIQLVRVVDPIMKNRDILSLLHEAGLTDTRSAGKALVFCNTKRMCEQLSNSLSRSGVPCASIHGDKDQQQRDDALNGLKTGRIKVLVATDVAARGLDIKGVGLVVNFDPANNTEDYVHRIGRTGRAGAKGFAVTFLTSADAGKARGIMEVMERTDQKIDDQLRSLAGDFQGGGRSRGGKGRYQYGKGGGGGGGGGRSRSPSRFNGGRSRSPSRRRTPSL